LQNTYYKTQLVLLAACMTVSCYWCDSAMCCFAGWTYHTLSSWLRTSLQITGFWTHHT